MNKWMYEVKHHKAEDVLFAVLEVRWQEFRKSLKGLSTSEKLNRLETYLTQHRDSATDKFEGGSMAQAQVDNYINALKRGGQLDLEGNVVR